MLKNKKGMTLVEMVVSIAVLAIATLILATGFSTVIRHIGNATSIKNTGDEAFEMIESNNANNVIPEIKVRLALSNGEEIIDYAVEMKVSEMNVDEDSGDKVTFKKFSKTSNYVDEAKTFYEQIMHSMKELLNDPVNKLKEYEEKRIALESSTGVKYDPFTNINTQFRNDTFIDYFYVMELDGKEYPKLDQLIIDDCNRYFDETTGSKWTNSSRIKDVKINDKPMYMKFVLKRDFKDVFLVADSSATNPKVENVWRTRLVYNAGDNFWYYKVLNYAVKPDLFSEYNDGYWYYTVSGYDTQNSIIMWNELLNNFKNKELWHKVVIE